MAYGKRMKKTPSRSKRRPVGVRTKATVKGPARKKRAPVKAVVKKPPVRGAVKKKPTRRLVDNPGYRRARRNRMTESKIARNARTRTPQSQARNRMRAAQIRRGIAQPMTDSTYGPDL